MMEPGPGRLSFVLKSPSIASQTVACVNHIPPGTGQKAVQWAAACDVVHEFVCQNLDFLETISEVPEPNSNDRTQSSHPDCSIGHLLRYTSALIVRFSISTSMHD